jgi:large subunit ribosomal protein L25
MAAAELDSIVHLSDLKLPKGVELTQLALGEDHDQPVAAIHAPKVRASADDEDGEGEEAAGEE